MNHPTSALPELRGTAVGSLSAALAIAAHGIGGGAYPSPSALVLLVLTCGLVGAAVARCPLLTRRRGGLLGALAVGQLAGHLSLLVAALVDAPGKTAPGKTGPGMTGSNVPGHGAMHCADVPMAGTPMPGMPGGLFSPLHTAAMIAAHLIAAAACAALIATAERVAGPLTNALRTMLRPGTAPVPARPLPRLTGTRGPHLTFVTDQLAQTIVRRGPPVCL